MSHRFKKIKREHIFDLFSENIELVKQEGKIPLFGEKTSGYICPICKKIFDKRAFDSKYIDQLTLEHVPPGKLGGSVELLTCKICNNEQGSKLEKHLQEKLLTEDFLTGIPGASRRASFLVNQKWYTGGRIINTDFGGFHMKTIKANSHEEHYEQLFEKGGIDVSKIDFTIIGDYKSNRANIALLRIAYLILYSKFGFAALLNPNFDAIRKQILYPDLKLMDNIITIRGDYSDQFKGVNLVTYPKELRSFAVAFRTKTDHKERKHIVLLPGPSQPGLKIYENLKGQSDRGGIINFNMTKIGTDNVLTDRKKVLAFFWCWNNIETIRKLSERN